MPANTAFLEVPCRTCNTAGWERVQRIGFLEKKVLPLFHLYPWRCPICNKQKYFSLRADPRIKHPRDSGEHALGFHPKAHTHHHRRMALTDQEDS